MTAQSTRSISRHLSALSPAPRVFLGPDAPPWAETRSRPRQSSRQTPRPGSKALRVLLAAESAQGSGHGAVAAARACGSLRLRTAPAAARVSEPPRSGTRLLRGSSEPSCSAAPGSCTSSEVRPLRVRHVVTAAAVQHVTLVTLKTPEPGCLIITLSTHTSYTSLSESKKNHFSWFYSLK